MTCGYKFFVNIGCALFRLGNPPQIGGEIACADEIACCEEAIASIPACPLMHATGMWLGAMAPLCVGASVATLTGSAFDAHVIVSLVFAIRMFTA